MFQLKCFADGAQATLPAYFLFVLIRRQGCLRSIASNMSAERLQTNQ